MKYETSKFNPNDLDIYDHAWEQRWNERWEKDFSNNDTELESFFEYNETNYLLNEINENDKSIHELLTEVKHQLKYNKMLLDLIEKDLKNNKSEE